MLLKGLATISSQFAVIKRLGIQDDEVALIEQLPKILRFRFMCLTLPGVNIAQAIVYHGNKVELFLHYLPTMIKQGESTMDKTLVALPEGDLTSTQHIKPLR